MQFLEHSDMLAVGASSQGGMARFGAVVEGTQPQQLGMTIQHLGGKFTFDEAVAMFGGLPGYMAAEGFSPDSVPARPARRAKTLTPALRREAQIWRARRGD